jgi:NRPS condensation-like uncharacterized protein
MRVMGELGVEELEKAVKYVVDRHESLRTRFESEEGRPRQVIEERVEVEVEKRDLRGWKGAEQNREMGEELERMMAKPFDLGQGPLLRVVVLQLGEEEHVLGLCLHHLICDAWSMRVLLEELSEAYQAYREGAVCRLCGVAATEVESGEGGRGIEILAGAAEGI